MWVSLANVKCESTLDLLKFLLHHFLFYFFILTFFWKTVTVTLHLDVISVMKAVLSWPVQAASQTPVWTLRRVAKFSHWSPSLASCSPPDSVTGPRPPSLRVKFEVQGTQGQSAPITPSLAAQQTPESLMADVIFIDFVHFCLLTHRQLMSGRPLTPLCIYTSAARR